MTYPGASTLPANPQSCFVWGGRGRHRQAVSNFHNYNLITSHLNPSVASFPLFLGCRPGYSTYIRGPTPSHLQCPPQPFCLSISPLAFHTPANQPTSFQPQALCTCYSRNPGRFSPIPCLVNSYSFFRSVKLPLTCEIPDKTTNSCIFLLHLLLYLYNH